MQKKTNYFKDIHIGSLIEFRVKELRIEIPRICKFFRVTEEKIAEMYESDTIDVKLLLKWSKLLEYDFFRIYSQHIILYSPERREFQNRMENNDSPSVLPKFRKNIYTKELIDYILEVISSGEMTKRQVIQEYGIPKTTLYKWLVKY